jgi:spore maturation protein CgeB
VSWALDLAIHDEMTVDRLDKGMERKACVGNEIMIIGSNGCADVGTHLCSAASACGLTVRFMSSEQAHTSIRLLRSFARRLQGDFPLRAHEFNRAVCRQLADTRPRWLLTTGKAPVLCDTLAEARRLGVISINYSTDDPWNPRHAARWFFSALKEYDVVATPRLGTILDFHRLGVRRVAHASFAYCPKAHRPDDRVVEDVSGGDIFFAGGCDNDRLPYFQAIVKAGLRPMLYGGYWNRHLPMRRFYRGFASVSEMATLHAQAPISICLVRRANRDEHVMRTFEAAAMGACLAMEDTPAHRQLFGPDGRSVVYFSDPQSLVSACQRLLADAGLRQHLRLAAREVVVGGRNTYNDRLKEILAVASVA